MGVASFGGTFIHPPRMSGSGGSSFNILIVLIVFLIGLLLIMALDPNYHF